MESFGAAPAPRSDAGQPPEAYLEYLVSALQRELQRREVSAPGHPVARIDAAAEIDALRRARDHAEELTRLKDDQLATLSHELRTPLSAVIGITDLLAEEIYGPITEKQAEQLVKVRTSARHMISVTEQILRFFRAEAGQEEVRYEEADVAVIARDIAGMLEHEARAHDLEFATAGLDAPVFIRTDPDKVRQILVNLLANAFKYTTAGRVGLELVAGDPVEIRVSDTGPGIDADALESIFEPFVRIRGDSSKAQGTGLGLAVCRRLARLLQGDVSVQSTPGRGSTFTLRLPIEAPH